MAAEFTIRAHVNLRHSQTENIRTLPLLRRQLLFLVLFQFPLPYKFVSAIRLHDPAGRPWLAGRGVDTFPVDLELIATLCEDLRNSP